MTIMMIVQLLYSCNDEIIKRSPTQKFGNAVYLTLITLMPYFQCLLQNGNSDYSPLESLFISWKIFSVYFSARQNQNYKRCLIHGSLVLHLLAFIFTQYQKMLKGWKHKKCNVLHTILILLIILHIIIIVVIMIMTLKYFVLHYLNLMQSTNISRHVMLDLWTFLKQNLDSKF